MFIPNSFFRLNKILPFIILCFAMAACRPSIPAPATVTATAAATSLPTSTPIPPTPTPIPPTPTPIPPQDLPFPRLAMWWPDPYTQPLKDIARYDYVDLFPWESEFIDPLRKLNPNIIILDQSNACEVGYDPQNPANNLFLQEIPPEWYLTQVGTSLRADVDASQTNLPVQALTVSNGITTYDLFVPGDTVLIAGESVYVKAVDKASRTLTVERGYIRPASAHPAGTRIAAHISQYPNSWVLNISTLSPKGVADPAVGLETWASYRARLDARLLDDPRWDGLLVDRTGPNQSLYVNSYARTIDPDQSNTLLNDYVAFDTAWNAGLSLYLQDLRERIGPNKIIQLNTGINDFSVVNGTNFEDYPTDAADNWHSYTIGPSWANMGSYFEWMANARQPNLTMLQTWEDDSGNAISADTVPNYRKMRFGLTTALLNNGFFEFLIGNGYGPHGLKWFDEYDNAGAALGYLGQPLGPAALVDMGSFTPTTVASSGFNSYEYADMGIWDLVANPGYAASRVIDTSNPADGPGSLRVDVTESKGVDWEVSLEAQPIVVTKGTNYTLSFRARADHPLPISIGSQQNHDPWTGWIFFSIVPLTTEWQQYTFTARSIGSDAQARLIFTLGKTTGTVWLDDVLLQTTRPDVYRRDFEHGIVLVNASGDPVTIPLGGTFKKINGTQDRTVNDGSTVTEVTLPPLDGIILLRP